jgi:hypothetical protein
MVLAPLLPQAAPAAAPPFAVQWLQQQLVRLAGYPVLPLPLPLPRLQVLPVLPCTLCQLLLLVVLLTLLLCIPQLALWPADVSAAALLLLLVVLAACGTPASHCMLAAGMGDGVEAAGDNREPEVFGDHSVGSCLALSWHDAAANCWLQLLLQLLGLGLIICIINDSTTRSGGLR